MRLGYARGRGNDLTEYTVLPSILADYYWTKDLSFEAEVGVQWTSTTQAGIRSRDTEVMATVGVRYDFYSDTSTQAGRRKEQVWRASRRRAVPLQHASRERQLCVVPDQAADEAVHG